MRLVRLPDNLVQRPLQFLFQCLHRGPAVSLPAHVYSSAR